MQIWVDADACPKPIKEILFRAAERTGLRLTLVANHPLRVPPSPLIRAVQVPAGFDVADNLIVQELAPGDLVVTQDIPLAAAVLEGGGEAINPRGERYTASNIGQRLAMRDFMEQMRDAGLASGGPAAFSHADRKAFAQQLDQLLNQRR